MDSALATAVIGASGTDATVIANSRYWRTITTAVGPGAQPATRVYRLGEEVALVAESGALGGFAYLPNLVELPAGVAPGRHWGGTGTLGSAAVTYSSDFAAAPAADPGCLAETGRITYTVKGENVERAVARTWCPGRGLVASTDRWLGTTVTVAPTDPPALAAPPTEPPRSRWAPRSWVLRALPVVSVDAAYGQGEVGGGPSAVAAALSRSGLVLRATATGNDVVAFGPGDQGRWRSRWRAHPGGTVLTVTAVGDVAVATTSVRDVVGYDANGVRRWQLRTDEVVRAQPVRSSATELALVTLGGEVVVLDAATGTVRWRRSPGRDVGVAPSTAAGLVAVTDREGQLSVLDARSGDPRWQSDVDGPRFVAASADQLVVLSDTAVDAFEPAGGRRRWHTGIFGTPRGVVAFASWVVVTTSEGVVALDGHGRAAWSRPGALDVSTNGTFLVVWGRSRAEVLDATGRHVTDVGVADRGIADAPQHLVAPGGLYLLGDGWNLQEWSA